MIADNFLPVLDRYFKSIFDGSPIFFIVEPKVNYFPVFSL